MPLRVVVDTNVLIAALRSETGASAEVLREVYRGGIEIQISPSLFLQYVDVASRHMAELRFSVQETQAILAHLCDVARQQEVYFLLRPSSTDPQDEMVLEVAVASGAQFIVTHNTRHFTEASKYGVHVVGPIELLWALGARR